MCSRCFLAGRADFLSSSQRRRWGLIFSTFTGEERTRARLSKIHLFFWSGSNWNDKLVSHSQSTQFLAVCSENGCDKAEKCQTFYSLKPFFLWAVGGKMELWLEPAFRAGVRLCLFCRSRCFFPGEEIKADYLCSSLQDLWRELHSVPSCKRSCSAALPQIPLQQRVLEAVLTESVGFMSRVQGGCGCCYHNGGRWTLLLQPLGDGLLFASSAPEFTRRCL